MEIIPKDEDLGRIEKVLDDFFSAVEVHVIEGLDMEMADALVETLKNIT